MSRFCVFIALLLLPTLVNGQDIDLRVEAGSLIPLSKLGDPATAVQSGATMVYTAEREPAVTLSAALIGWMSERVGVGAFVAWTASDVRWIIPEQSYPLPGGGGIGFNHESGTSQATLSEFSARGIYRFTGHTRFGAEWSAGLQFNKYSGFRDSEIDASLIGPVAGMHLYSTLANSLRVGMSAAYATYPFSSRHERQHDLSVTAGLTFMILPDHDK